MNYKIVKDDEIILVGSSELIREKIELMLEDTLDFFVMLQEEIAEDDNIELFVHTETYAELEEQQEDKLFKLGITDDISKDQICQYLGVSIQEEHPNEIMFAKKSA